MIYRFFLYACLTTSLHGFQTSVKNKFNPNDSHKSSLFLSATAKTSDVNVANNLPFFATLSDPPAEKGSTTVTTRLPLGTIFDSRDYIFTTATNVRGYEWTIKETDELLDDLTDASLGQLTSSLDYELSQIVLVPMEWDQASYGLGGIYDVHDGQQRLVTLCLIFAALRESFRNEEGMEDTVTELANMLNPPKVRKADILRIELGKRDNEVLRRILVHTHDLDLEFADFLNKSGATNNKVKMLSVANQRILQNYQRLLSRVSTFSKDERVQLLDFMVEHVHMLVCIPETGTIARNIVMAQGKGKDNEPIDDFKGLVCFRYTQNESDMYEAFDKWDNLAADPDFENGSVGRDIISSACLLRATATLRTKIRKNNQVQSMERWLRHILLEENYQWEGRDFFCEVIEPASLALGKYKDGNFDSFGFITKGKDSQLKTLIAVRLNFLRSLTSSVTATKELEAVVLELILRAEGAESDDDKSSSLKELDRHLHGLELVALWMALTKPSALQRYQRCFEFLDSISSVDEDGSTNASISQEEKSSLREELVCHEFGVTSTGKKIASALLERLNSHIILHESGQEYFPDGSLHQLHVEHILPTKATKKSWGEDWPNREDREKWMHRLGNLVLLSRKSTAKAANLSFADKKERYKNEVWPLTSRMSELESWNNDMLIKQMAEIFQLVDKVWSL